ncbi:MAG: hypothetical protein AAFY88_07655, partial [Acidobacteriota bacterium]
DRGFFQIAGASEGEFRLQITPPGPLGFESTHPPMRLDGVALTASAETCLEDIVLTAGMAASFTVTPPVDPEGQPWTLTLIESTSSMSAPIHGEFDPQGVLVLEVPEGHYIAQLKTFDGLRVDRREVAVEGPVDVAIDLDLAAVQGRIRLGGEPLVAELR